MSDAQQQLFAIARELGRSDKPPTDQQLEEVRVLQMNCAIENGLLGGDRSRRLRRLRRSRPHPPADGDDA
jgi:hypothetical protein